MMGETGKNAKIAAICDEILTTCAVNNLRKLTRLTTSQFNDKIKPTGIRTTQMCIMFVIGNDPGKSLSTYAEALSMDLSTLARSIDTLVDAGYISLKSGNRRERLAFLTEAAEQKIDEVYPLWLEAQTEFIEAFGQEQWQAYLNAAHNSSS